MKNTSKFARITALLMTLVMLLSLALVACEKDDGSASITPPPADDTPDTPAEPATITIAEALELCGEFVRF